MAGFRTGTTPSLREVSSGLSVLPSFGVPMTIATGSARRHVFAESEQRCVHVSNHMHCMGPHPDVLGGCCKLWAAPNLDVSFMVAFAEHACGTGGLAAQVRSSVLYTSNGWKPDLSGQMQLIRAVCSSLNPTRAERSCTRHAPPPDFLLSNQARTGQFWSAGGRHHFCSWQFWYTPSALQATLHQLTTNAAADQLYRSVHRRGGGRGGGSGEG